MQARGTKDGGIGVGDQKTGGAPVSVPLSARGFSAQLRGASLWDLVQMECMARSRLTVQVVGEGGVGYLYFDRGHVVHATTAHRAGEAAALEILSWTNGSFQSCDRPWPEQATIATSHEGLILQAAQHQDESGATNLVAFPGRGAPPGAAAAHRSVNEDPPDREDRFEEIELTEVPEEGEREMRSTNTDDALSAPKNGRADSRGEPGSGDFSVVLRLGPNGAVISNRGGSEQLAETVAYTQRLVQLAGELLGFEAFSAIECSFVEGRCIIFSEGDGEIVALRPRPEANLQALRERLGL